MIFSNRIQGVNGDLKVYFDNKEVNFQVSGSFWMHMWLEFFKCDAYFENPQDIV